VNKLKIDLTVISEVARSVIAKGYPLDRDATLDSYLNYILAQLTAERAAKTHRHVLSDRSLIDLLAYVRVNADVRIPTHLNSLLEEIVWIEADYYDVYCYIPVEFVPIDDGIRCIDGDYQQLVDAELVRLFREYQVPTIRISESHDERQDHLLSLFGI